jgi:hypothetical protein
MKIDSTVCFLSLAFISLTAGFNVMGITITKYSSSAQRSTIDSSRTVFIWAASLMIGWEKFIGMQLVGFFFLVIGTLVYNEIYVPPFDIFRKNTKEYLEEHDKMDDYLQSNEELVMDGPIEFSQK